MIHTTSIAIVEKCEIMTGEIENLQLHSRPQRDDILEFTIMGQENTKYLLYLHGFPDRDAPNLINRIQMESGDLTITVLKDYDPIPILGDEKCVVDIRSENAVYYDVAIYNSYQKTARLSAIIAIAILGSLFFAVQFIYCFIEYAGDIHCFKKRKTTKERR